MATTAIPLSQYLDTVYRPDCDYIHGEVQERNLGEKFHARLQLFLAMWFAMRWQEFRCEALPELRVEVSPGNYRVPDVTVLRPGQTFDRILRQAPLLMIEIMSPKDRLNRIAERVNDYILMGADDVWVVDPEKRRAYAAHHGRLEELADPTLVAAAGTIRIPLAEVWAQLER